MNRERGSLMIEMLVGSIIAVLIGAVVFHAFVSAADAKDVVIGQNKSAANARAPIDVMADHLRNAQMYTSTNAVLYDAAQSDITYYSDKAGSKIRYYLSNGDLLRQVGDATATTALQDVTSLTFTYYKASAYNSTSTTTTTNSHVPTTAELPYITSVRIDAVVQLDGYTTEYSSTVRLRNSPKRTYS